MAAESSPKLYFTIGEVARLAQVKAHVLRFWEEQFPGLSPKKDAAGRRVYRKRDIDMVMKIKELLHDRKFTIAGARRTLLAAGLEPPPVETTEMIKNELKVVLALLTEG